MARTQELRPGVYVIGTENWRLNSGLVLGTQRALVIDTGAGPRQGREILTAVRELTELPLTVVNTHAHYDHYMGNAVFTAPGPPSSGRTRRARPRWRRSASTSAVS